MDAQRTCSSIFFPPTLAPMLLTVITAPKQTKSTNLKTIMCFLSAQMPHELFHSIAFTTYPNGTHIRATYCSTYTVLPLYRYFTLQCPRQKWRSNIVGSMVINSTQLPELPIKSRHAHKPHSNHKTITKQCLQNTTESGRRLSLGFRWLELHKKRTMWPPWIAWLHWLMVPAGGCK